MHPLIAHIETTCYETIKSHPNKTGKNICTEVVFNKEKFAKLIIQEVIAAAYDEIQYATSYSVANEIHKSLNKQFGLEFCDTTPTACEHKST